MKFEIKSLKALSNNKFLLRLKMIKREGALETKLSKIFQIRILFLHSDVAIHMNKSYYYL